MGALASPYYGLCHLAKLLFVFWGFFVSSLACKTNPVCVQLPPTMRPFLQNLTVMSVGGKNMMYEGQLLTLLSA